MKTYTATYTSPLGPIVIESDGKAITSLRFSSEIASAAPTTQEKAGEEAATALPIIVETIQWLNDYFAGKRPCNVPHNSIRKAPLSRSAFGRLYLPSGLVRPRRTERLPRW